MVIILDLKVWKVAFLILGNIHAKTLPHFFLYRESTFYVAKAPTNAPSMEGFTLGIQPSTEMWMDLTWVTGW